MLEEGKQDTDAGQDTVPFSKYVGVKSMLDREEKAHEATKGKLEALSTELSKGKSDVTRLETTVADLEEQLKTSKNSVIDPEEHKKLVDELTEIKGKTLETKKTQVAKDYGVAEETVKEFTEDQLDLFIKGIEAAKGQGKEAEGESEKDKKPAAPKADMGDGGRSDTPTKGKDIIAAGWKNLHPEDSF